MVRLCGWRKKRERESEVSMQGGSRGVLLGELWGMPCSRGSGADHLPSGLKEIHVLCGMDLNRAHGPEKIRTRHQGE